MQSRQSCMFVEPDGTKVRGYRWRNPDGTIGGWVAETAAVHPSVTVELGAMISPGAKIAAGEIIKSGQIIGPADDVSEQ